MGGREALRGFLYQGFASVLEALSDEINWDKIYVEFPTSNDKVDIALEQQGKVIKCIQVKSSINIFTKLQIKKWLYELINDIESSEYELFLIGQCYKDANTFIKSIKKYYMNELNKESESSLNGFIDVLDKKKISFSILPFDIKHLEAIVRDSLHRYLSHSNHIITFNQISLIVSAMVNEQMICSTKGIGVDRDTFDQNLKKQILLVADKYTAKREPIGIKSFTRATENMEESMKCLSLIDKFEERNIKNGYDWNNDIYEEVKNFLFTNISKNHKYQIFLETHLSIAFAAGRILDTKTGFNVFPMQKTSVDGVVLWDLKLPSKKIYSDWDISDKRFDENKVDSVLIISVTHNIYNDVIRYIKENNLLIGRVIHCMLNGCDATNFSIEDGNHAAALANSIYNAIGQRTTIERKAILHIFASAPNAFMFFLGKSSLGFGKCILYEYDFEQRNSCSYSPSINFTH